MRVRDSMSPNPISVEKTVRSDEIRVLTSGKAGRIIPVAFAPVLREDRVSRGSIRIKYDMAETVRPLMNAVNVTAYAHFIPYLAFERFAGSMDLLNRSYKNTPPAGGVGNAVPFIELAPLDITPQQNVHTFWRTLGVHWRPDRPINSAPLEAYNVLANHRRKVRSEHLPQRSALDASLARAFWKNPRFAHIVPDYDPGMLDGEVPLSLNLPSTASRLPVQGISITHGTDGTPTGDGITSMVQRRGDSSGAEEWRLNVDGEYSGGGAGSTGSLEASVFVTLPEIFAELGQQGIALSLANIELAKKTVAFAKLRDQFTGLDENYLIDLLMGGIRIPDEYMKQPILLDRKSTIFGYTERHATDGASLDQSVTTGLTEVTLNFRMPEMNTGGVILITTEIVPEQLFERQKDRFLEMQDPDWFPEFLRDYLDPEKVEVVHSDEIDVLHTDFRGVFGYAPLNHNWKRSHTRVGGRYYRPATETFVEDRQRIWSPEVVDPRLNTDFYLVPRNLSHSVFADTQADPFEILALGRIELVGNTVFGQALYEDDGHYDAVMDKVDTSRILQDSQAGRITSGPNRQGSM